MIFMGLVLRGIFWRLFLGFGRGMEGIWVDRLEFGIIIWFFYGDWDEY